MTCSIGKVGAGGMSYYTESVAKDAHDYRTGRGEAEGVWLGSLAETLGIAGQEVTTEHALAAFDARNPLTGDSLLGNRSRAQRKVMAYDLTFSAPKSVSLAWAMTSNDAIREALRAAHDAAHADAIGYFERNVLRTRTRAGGSEKLNADAVLVASYRHRTSRAGDPNLHSHDVVYNFTQGEDGHWRTIDSPPIYNQSKTMGMIYHARLRAEITERLGWRFGEVTTNGQAELVGFDRSQLAAFSKRRSEILDTARESIGGGITGKAYQVANLSTRSAKPEEDPNLYERWQQEAQEQGVSDVIAELVAQRQGRSWVTDLPTQADLDRLVLDPLTGITSQTTVFARHDLVRFLATQLPAGASSTALEELAQHMLAQSPGIVPLGRAEDTTLHVDDVIRVPSGRLLKTTLNTERYTTEDLLRTEIDAVALAIYRNQSDNDCATVAAEDFAALRSRAGLVDDQAKVLRRLLRGGEPVSMVTGPPGTGKTFTLNAAHQGWKAAGYEVFGACLAATAAENLQAETGIAATTVAQLVGRLRDGYFIPAGAVLVLDEVGQIGTRELALLLEAAYEAHSKIVCIIDDRQLPSIQAGGLGRALVARLGAVELTNNRRQRNATEREAVRLLRAGEIKTAYNTFQQAGDVERFATPHQLEATLVGHYLAARQQPRTDDAAIVPEVAIYTSTWNEAQRISDVVREELRARGQLGVDEIGIISAQNGDRRSFAIGDEVLLKRNEYQRLNVRNSNLAVIESIGDRTITVRLASGQRKNELVTLDSAYLEAGHLEHAYARVVAANQGATIDTGFYLATSKTCMEEALVALSRGRLTNRMYLLDENEQDVLDAMQLRSTEATAAEHLTEDILAAADERLAQLLEQHQEPGDRTRIRARAAQLRPKLEENERTNPVERLTETVTEQRRRSIFDAIEERTYESGSIFHREHNAEFDEAQERNPFEL